MDNSMLAKSLWGFLEIKLFVFRFFKKNFFLGFFEFHFALDYHVSIKKLPSKNVLKNTLYPTPYKAVSELKSNFVRN